MFDDFDNIRDNANKRFKASSLIKEYRSLSGDCILNPREGSDQVQLLFLSLDRGASDWAVLGDTLAREYPKLTHLFIEENYSYNRQTENETIIDNFFTFIKTISYIKFFILIDLQTFEFCGKNFVDRWKMSLGDNVIHAFYTSGRDDQTFCPDCLHPSKLYKGDGVPANIKQMHDGTNNSTLYTQFLADIPIRYCTCKEKYEEYQYFPSDTSGSDTE